MYFVGVDAGGTKTSFVLTEENGHILARHLGGSGSFLDRGADGIRALISDGIQALCNSAAIDRDEIAGAGLGFPGYGEQAGSEQQIMQACEDAIGAGKVVCECDSYLGWAGSLGMQPGINIVAGTGSICFGVNDAGDSARTGGWGAYCDEGSCRWIGERLIRVWTSQSDGRLPRTQLYDMFRQYFGIEHDLHFIDPLNHELGRDSSKTAKLQGLLLQMFAAGDPHAQVIYREAAFELWLAIRTTAHKLGITDSTFLVSYSGGLFRAGETVLGPLREHVGSGGGTLVAPRFEPELGGVLMAMRRQTIGRDFSAMRFFD